MINCQNGGGMATCKEQTHSAAMASRLAGNVTAARCVRLPAILALEPAAVPLREVFPSAAASPLLLSSRPERMV